MSKCRRILAIVVSFILFLSSLELGWVSIDVSAAASKEFTKDNITYTILSNDISVRITKGEDTKTQELVIPEKLTYDGDSYTVTEIGENAFSGYTSLVSLTIPDSVTSIGYRAFFQCTSLSQITLSKNLNYMGGQAFGECTSLKEIELPASLTKCGTSYSSNAGRSVGPFGDCSNLTKVTFEKGTEQMASNVLAGCDGITSVTIPASVEKILDGAMQNCSKIQEVIFETGSTLSVIGSYVFYNCTKITSMTLPAKLEKVGDCTYASCSRLASIKLPDSVTSIGYQAFYKCISLSQVTLSKNLSYMGGQAFGECTSLNEIELPASLTKCDTSYSSNAGRSVGPFGDCNKLTKVTFEKGTEQMASYVLSGCTGITTITIPASIVTMNEGAIQNCTNLQEITFEAGSNLKEIGIYALYNCSKLTNIKIPEKLEKIGDCAFGYCSKLESITVPDAVTNINYQAFYKCNSLNQVTLSKNLNYMGGQAFGECTSLKEIKLPASLTKCDTSYSSKAGRSVGPFGDCSSLTNVTFEKGTEQMASYVLSGCTGITTITIPASIETLKEGAIQNCTNLQEITFETGSSLKEIGTYALYNCSKLTNIKIPEKLEKIGDCAFGYCSKLESITVPDAVTNINYQAFYKCNSLNQVTLSKNLNYMGGQAFGECTLLKEIELPASLTKCDTSYSSKVGWSVGPFGDCSNLTKVTFEKGTEQIASNVLSGCNGITTLTIPASIATIADGAMQNCTKLQQVTFESGSNLKEIMSSAFYNCYKLIRIELPLKVETLGYDVFNKCSRLESVELTNHVTSFKDRIFDNCTNLIIYTPTYSEGMIYAIDHGYNVLSNNDLYIEDSKSILDHNKSSYSYTISSNYTNGYKALTIDYSLKKGKLDTVSDLKVAFRTPINAKMVDKTLMLDGELCTNYTEQNNMIIIPVHNESGKITFYCKPTSSSIVSSYAKLMYRSNNTQTNEIIGVINNKVSSLTIETNAVTNSNEVLISGVAPAKNDINIYVGNSLVATLQANKAGSYSGTVNLGSVKSGTVYTLKATTKDSDSKVIEASTKVKYGANLPVLTEFRMYYNGQSYDLSSSNNPPVIFRPELNYTFKIQFDHQEQIENVYVLSVRNNVTKKIKAFYDEKTGCYITSEKFDPSDSSYLPGDMNVFFTLKEEKNPDTEEDSEIEISTITEHLGETDVKEVQNTETKFEASIDFEKYGTFDYQCNKYSYEESKQVLAEKYGITSGLNVSDSEYPMAVSKKLDDFIWSEVTDTFVSGMFMDDGIMTQLVVDVGSHSVYEYTLANGGDATTEPDWESMINDCYSLMNATGDFDLGTTVGKNIIKSGIRLGGIAIDVAAARREIMQSNRSQAEKEQLLKELDTYEHQACAIEVWKVVGSVCKSAGMHMVMAGNPWGLALLAGGLIIDRVVVPIKKANLEDSSIGFIGFFEYLLTGGLLRWACDPSGYVYEAVETNRLKDVKTTVYYKVKLTDAATLWDASEYNQCNPLITDQDGNYAWDVPEGYWQVKYERNGYQTAYSEWLEVPPPQTNVNIGMVSEQKPELSSFNVYTTYAELVFTQYMDISTIASLKIQDNNGKDVPYTLSYTEEKAPNGKAYANIFRLEFTGGYTANTEKQYTLLATKESKNYAGTSLDPITKQSTVRVRPSIVTANSVTIKYGESVTIPVQLINATGTEQLECSSDFQEVAKLTSIGTIAKDGSTNITVNGSMSGSATLIVRLKDTNIESIIHVLVNEDDSKIEGIKPSVTIPSKEYRINVGDRITINPIITPTTEKGQWNYDTDKKIVSNTDNVFTALTEGKIKIRYELLSDPTVYDECTIMVEKKQTKNISTCKISLSQTTFIATANVQKPTITVEGAKEGEDYTVTYSNPNSILPGTYTVTVTGCGTYTGTKTFNYSITAKNQITDIKLYCYNSSFDNKAHTAIAVKGTKAGDVIYYSTNKKDWIKTVPTIKNVSDSKVIYVKVTRTGCEDWISTPQKAAVTPLSISKLAMKLSATSYNWNGKIQKPTVTINGIQYNSDFIVTYSNAKSINAGSYKVTINGKGNYTGTITKTYSITVGKWKKYRIGDLYYVVTNASTNGKGTVSVAGGSSSKLKKIKIETTVRIGGILYQITAIDKKAFRNYKKLTSVAIGDNVTTIQSQAFESCTALSYITLGAKVTTIDKYAFNGDKKLSSITIKSKKLKSIGKKAFQSVYKRATFKIYKKYYTKYYKILKKSSIGYTKYWKFKKM